MYNLAHLASDPRAASQMQVRTQSGPLVVNLSKKPNPSAGCALENGLKSEINKLSSSVKVRLKINDNKLNI